MRVIVPVLLLALAGCVSFEETGDGDPAAPSASPTGAGGTATTSSSPASGTSSTSATESCDTFCSCPYLDGCGIPTHDPSADVAFRLNASYRAGEAIRWSVHNNGTAAYSAMVPTACSVEVYSQAGRRIPLGACYTDVVAAVRITAGNDTDLGTWPGGECVRSERQWYAGGCIEWRPLPAGSYEVRRSFCRYGENWREDCSVTSRSGVTVVLA